MDEFDAYEFDTGVQSLKAWLEKRLKANKRDSIDTLARRILADSRLPRQASKSMYLAHLQSKKYSTDDQATFECVWSEMKTEQLESEK